jgi:hypothetical protein
VQLNNYEIEKLMVEQKRIRMTCSREFFMTHFGCAENTGKNGINSRDEINGMKNECWMKPY